MSPSTEPFNEAKYKALMDGLECRELMLSYVLASSEGGRMDSHFFEKKYEKVISAVKRNNPVLLKNIVEKPIQTGHTPSMKEDRFYGGNIAFIKTNNLREGFITTFFDNYLTDVGNATIARTSLRQGDIITTIIGANEKVVARSALITEEFLPSNINQNIVQIRINKDIIDPEYVYVYLNSFYGKQYLYYYSRQMEQVNLNCDEVGMVEIPIFSKKFIELVTKASIKYNALINKSRQTYADAENCLLKELGIDMSTIPSGGVSVKSFSECFGSTGRLDAEYYQPKYDELVRAIKVLPHKRLIQIANMSKSIEPGSEAYRDEGIPFVRISDISKYGITETDKYLEPGSEYDNANYYLKKDEILFSKDGSVGIAYKVEGDAKMISSSALLHLSIKDKNEVLPDYLTAVLNSEIVQLQAERDAGGSIIKHWKPGEIEEVLIPILSKEKQIEISKKAAKSFELRNRSKELLECAKTAVEMAIEKDEARASSWLKEKLSELTGEVPHE